MLGLAVQHQEVAEGGRGEGGCLEQVAQLPEAACWVNVHAEQRYIVQCDLQATPLSAVAAPAVTL